MLQSSAFRLRPKPICSCCACMADSSTVSLQLTKQVISSANTSADHSSIALTHAVCVSPSSLTSGSDSVTAISWPTGAMDIRTMESISRSCKERVIKVESVPYGTLIAV